MIWLLSIYRSYTILPLQIVVKIAPGSSCPMNGELLERLQKLSYTVVTSVDNNTISAGAPAQMRPALSE